MKFLKHQPFLFKLLLLLLVAVSCKQKKTEAVQAIEQIYTCSMHPQIIRNQPGDCPICGMHLIKKEENSGSSDSIELSSVLRPTNSFVLSAIPVTTVQNKKEPLEINVLGSVTYDTRTVGTIAAKTTGRIEKLYVHYRFQKIMKGQKIMDIYSPEILTAQQNLIFLLQNDSNNTMLINAAKERLINLGLSADQLQELIRTEKPFSSISIYSNYTGHIHEAGNNTMVTAQGAMKDISTITEELPLKEGMYVQKGQTVFTVFNPDKVWALVNIYDDDLPLVKMGNNVTLHAETLPDKTIQGKINFIEPFLRKDSKTITARIYFDNSSLKIPVGSQVKATITGDAKTALWLSVDALVSLGINKVVFLKEKNGFKAHKIETGTTYKNNIQIIGGLTPQDTIAANARFLIDSESFIKTKE